MVWALWANHISTHPVILHDSLINCIGPPPQFLPLFTIINENESFRESLLQTNHVNMVAIDLLVRLKESMTRTHLEHMREIEMQINFLLSINKSAVETIDSVIHANNVSHQVDVDHVYI